MSVVERVLFISGTSAGATLRYRVRLAEEALRSRGIHTTAIHFSEPALRTWAAAADVIVLYRVPITSQIVSLVRWAQERGIAVTFDVDDRVFSARHGEHLPFLDRLAPRKRRQFLLDLPRRGASAALADRGSGATAAIVADLSEIVPGPVDLLPNGVGRVALSYADAVVADRGSPDTVRLGYFSGSATHDQDWARIEADVVEVMQADVRVELWLVGPLRPSIALAPVAARVRTLGPVEWYDLFALLAQVDVNLAPLADSPFAEAKSAIKWLEAALVRTPTIATSTEPFRFAVRDGIDAVLVADGSWVPALTALVADAPRRLELGAAARVAALDRFGPERQADRYQQFIQAAADGSRTVRSGADIATALDSGPRLLTVGATLQAYPFEADLADLTLPRPGWDGPVSATRTFARATVGNVRSTVRGIARKLRR